MPLTMKRHKTFIDSKIKENVTVFLDIFNTVNWGNYGYKG